MRETLRGALLSVLFFGGVSLLAVAPMEAQAGGDADDCPTDECVTVTGKAVDVDFLNQQLDALERLFEAHYRATLPTNTTQECYSDCLICPSYGETNRLTAAEVNQMVDEACAMLSEVTAIGGIAALSAAGAERLSTRFAKWVARYGGSQAAAKLLPGGLIMEVLAGACYIAGKV